MATLLLIIIYIAFISLGLPDSMFGAAWPSIRMDLSMPLSGAGLVSFIVAGGTIVSSLLSGKLIKKLGTGKLTLISVFMTAMPLLGFAFSHNYLTLCLLGIPLGLGAGAVDAGLNNFVALHFSARHMSWLHCFWGVGATAGPVIMSAAISRSGKWQNGYLIVAIIQISLVIILLLSQPIWNKFKESQAEAAEVKEAEDGNVLKLPGIFPAMIGFFCYCALESTTGLWGASYLVQSKGISAGIAAGWVSMFFLGITVGRFINGLFTLKFSNPVLIRAGQVIIGLGTLVLLLFQHSYFNLVGLVLIGMGCAPIYPSMLHETPERFGKNNSSSLMGLQMAFAYVGATVIPPVLGLIMGKAGMQLYPLFILILLVIMVVGSERVNRIVKKKVKE
jgi:fucose permease